MYGDEEANRISCPFADGGRPLKRRKMSRTIVNDVVSRRDLVLALFHSPRGGTRDSSGKVKKSVEVMTMVV